MSSYIPHQQPTDPAVDDNIANTDAFYPAVSLADFRRTMRVDDIATDARVAEQIRTAMLMINGEIAFWRAQQTATELSDEQAKAYYRIALYHRAKAYIIEQYRDVDTTKSGHDEASALETRINVYLQRSREALRMLINVGRMTVVLI